MIDATEFKDMMSRVAATVTIVTAPAKPEPVGMTVSAFLSVSADPPIVLVCLDKRSASLDAFLDAPGYTVNFMPEGTGDDAMVFATHGADKFGSVANHPAKSAFGGPVIDGAFGAFECRIVERAEVGDHWVLYGEVEESELLDADIAPLVWHGRGFVRIDD